MHIKSDLKEDNGIAMVHAQLLLDANISKNDKFMIWIKWGKYDIMNRRLSGKFHKGLWCEFWNNGYGYSSLCTMEERDESRKVQSRLCKQIHRERQFHDGKKSKKCYNYKYRSKHRYHRW